MDGSTDSGNKEEELFLAVYFEPFSTTIWCFAHWLELAIKDAFL